jgi:hypothetical protein
MKTSTRYMGGTLLAILALPLLLVLYSRFIAPPLDERTPMRTSAAELATLRDFSEIAVEGDFALELFAADDYSVTYEPLSDRFGELTASVDSGVLIINGFGHRQAPGVSRVRIGVPALRELRASSNASVTISGLDADALMVRANGVDEITLQDNTFANVDIRGAGVGGLVLRNNSFTNSAITLAGNTPITISN